MEHTKTYLDYKKKANEKFVRYDEGAEMYHMGISKFMQIAKDAKAWHLQLSCAMPLSVQGFRPLRAAMRTGQRPLFTCVK